MNQLNLNRSQKSEKLCSGGLMCTVPQDSAKQFLPYDSNATQAVQSQFPSGVGQQHYSQPRFSQLPQFQQQQMQGGYGASDWSGNFHSYSTSVSDLTNWGNARIANSPMFKPFSQTSKFATPSTGITPTGQYYMQ